MSQWCRIYQLADVHIHPDETPNELIEHLHGLNDHCGFPSNEEKERNIQYCFVCALSDSDLVHKLLALKLTATMSEMLELCHTHIAISDNMSTTGLTGSKTVDAICQQKQQHHHQHHHQQKSHTTSTAQHTCNNCTKSHVPSRSSCPAKDSVCSRCGCIGHWWPCCRSSGGPQAIKKLEGTEKKHGDHHHNCQQHGHRQTDMVDVGEDYNPQLDEVNMTRVTLQNDDEWLGANPKYITIADIDTNMKTEAFTTVKMPADIGPNWLEKYAARSIPTQVVTSCPSVYSRSYFPSD